MSEQTKPYGSEFWGAAEDREDEGEVYLTALRSAERRNAVQLVILSEMRTFESQMCDKSIAKADLFRSLAHVESRMYRRLREVETLDEDTRKLSEFVHRQQQVCDRWSIILSRFE